MGQGGWRIEQADGWNRGRKSGYHQWLKKHKRRQERRRAKKDPQCVPAYKKYNGYEL